MDGLHITLLPHARRRCGENHFHGESAHPALLRTEVGVEGPSRVSLEPHAAPVAVTRGDERGFSPQVPVPCAFAEIVPLREVVTQGVSIADVSRVEVVLGEDVAPSGLISEQFRGDLVEIWSQLAFSCMASMKLVLPESVLKCSMFTRMAWRRVVMSIPYSNVNAYDPHPQGLDIKPRPDPGEGIHVVLRVRIEPMPLRVLLIRAVAVHFVEPDGVQPTVREGVNACTLLVRETHCMISRA